MAEVASPLSLGAWDRPCPWSFGPELSRCLPLESQLYAGGPNISLVSFWNSITPKPQNVSGHKASMQARSSFSLSVQPPANVKKRRRSSAAPRRSEVVRLTGEDREDSSTPASSGNNQATQVPVNHQEGHANTNSLVGDATSRAGDLLFSTIGVDDGCPFNTQNLCNLCRLPFETDEAALHTHLENHVKELQGSLECQRCQISFSHLGDLNLHLQSKEHENFSYCSESEAQILERNSHLSEARLTYSLRLQEWEQAQLRLYIQNIEALMNERHSKRSVRSASLPPRKRKPLESWEATLLPNTACDSHMPSEDQDATVTSDPVTSTKDRTLQSLQQRIRNLMEQIVPSSPNDQDTPYSEFCETHSLPGSPDQISKDETIDKINRATSEPPHRAYGIGDRTKQTASCGGADFNGSSYLAYNGASQSLSQKRGNDERHSDRWNDENDDENGDMQPRKRKKGANAGTDVVKRFPCIYHVGDPIHFKHDTTRYPHISNMSRHLRSHDFYACSTCIVRFPNSQELQAHNKVIGHVQTCSDRSCKRTKPANSFFESEDCVHIRSAEDQWRELFTLHFNRPPPNVFDTSSSSQLIDQVTSTPLANASDVVFQSNATSFRNDSFVDYGLNGSFFDQAMECDLALAADSLVPSAPLNVDDYLVSEPSPDLNMATDARAVSVETGGAALRSNATESDQCKPSSNDAVAGLQQQMSALERMVSTQRANEKDQIQSLQEKVFQLEQKLYQSSEREQKLEAALLVIFDAFQATGAPSAQPDKPLWKLFMTHTGQAVGPATGPNEGQQEPVPSNSFTSMSPAVSFATLGKNAAQTPPDSTYGSTR